MEEKITYDDVPPASRVAVHKARDAAQALEVARQQQVESIGDIVQERVEHVLAKGTEQDKSIILARVPYICQDIKGINVALQELNGAIRELNSAIREMNGKMDKVKTDLDAKDEKNESKYVTKEAFSPFRWGLTIVGSVIITTLVGAVLAQIIIK